MMHIYDSVIGAQSDVNLIAISMITLFLYMLFFGFDWIRARIFIEISHSIERFFTAYIKIISKKYYFNETSLLSTLSALDTLKKFIRSPALPALFDLFFTPIFIALSFFIHPALGTLAIVSAILLLTTTVYLNAKNERLTQTYEIKNQTEISFGKAILCQPECMRFSVERDFLLKSWREKRLSAQESQLLVAKTSCFNTTFIKTLRMILQSTILGLGSWLVIHQNLSAGSIIATSIIVSRAITPLEQIMNFRKFFKIGSKALKNIIEFKSLSDIQEDFHDNKNYSAEQLPNSNIIVKNITIRHQETSHPLFQNLSFTIPGGTCCIVTGPSGCGKTSFLLCSLGLMPLENGVVSLGGINAIPDTIERLSSNVAYLSQRCTLFPISITENITLSHDSNALDRAREAAKIVGCHATISSLKDGYATIASSQNIPHSLMQNIRLARIVSQNPQIILMDEPLHHMDSEAENNFYILLKKFKASGKTIVITSQNPKIFDISDLSLILHPIAGPIFGPTQDLFKIQTIASNKNTMKI
ncbi:ATP-binding cassette domain-containing protein [Candidatus Liberibacter sp.]|uniref:ATP-binding cassette domain-containing protein n=1 Tax=Candidatus Liberibacter sp. TaxID=34022 RepID=UPI0021756785|nr:ATP-binding cassette domain-containing protein [Candidatus Liberibacter sp.]